MIHLPFRYKIDQERVLKQWQDRQAKFDEIEKGGQEIPAVLRMGKPDPLKRFGKAELTILETPFGIHVSVSQCGGESILTLIQTGGHAAHASMIELSVDSYVKVTSLEHLCVKDTEMTPYKYFISQIQPPEVGVAFEKAVDQVHKAGF